MPSRRNKSKPKHRVVIVGANFAGLSAAMGLTIVSSLNADPITLLSAGRRVSLVPAKALQTCQVDQTKCREARAGPDFKPDTRGNDNLQGRILAGEGTEQLPIADKKMVVFL